MKLHPIQPGGAVANAAGHLPAECMDVLTATAGLYGLVGYVPPWICYIATEGAEPVGTCGFKSPPAGGRVEIAYFTFPGHEGRGVATRMASLLITLAKETDPQLVVAAQTLPGRNASHRVLEKTGFICVEALEHPEDGPVLEWQQPAIARPEE